MDNETRVCHYARQNRSNSRLTPAQRRRLLRKFRAWLARRHA